MKTTTEPSSRVLDCTTADETSGFVNAVIEQVGDDYGYYVQLDLHGEDIEGPFSSWEDALERAVEAEANGETSGNW